MRSRASRPSCASSTEYPLKESDRRRDSRTARSSSTTSMRTATVSIHHLRLTGEARREARPASATVEIDEAEAGGLEQAPGHLVLLTGAGHIHQCRALGLPLRAPATGVRARHSALGHSHDRALLYGVLKCAPRVVGRRQLLFRIAGDLHRLQNSDFGAVTDAE